MSYLSASYVNQFRCDGAACQAACCRGWSVQLSAEDRDLVQLSLAKAPAPLTPLTDEIIADANADTASTRPFRLRMTEANACTFLATDHRCLVHGTLGESALPSVCAQYPREVGEVGNAREIWAALSCPVAARLALLTEHGADLVELKDMPGLRYVNQRVIIDDSTSDYIAYLDEIRRFVHELLSLRAFPLRARLFFVAYFAHRVSPYFNSEIRAVDRQRLKHDMQALRGDGMLKNLASELDAASVPGTYAISLVESVIRSRQGMAEYPGATIRPTSLDSNAPPNTPPNTPLEGHIVTAEWLDTWLDYATRRARWEHHFHPVLDQAFENYCKLYWMREWHFRSPNLLVHACACMLRLAIVRYRLFGHPTLTSHQAELTLLERHKLLEEALVEVVSEVARTIEHDRPFLATLDSAMARHGMQDLAHAAMLLVL